MSADHSSIKIAEDADAVLQYLDSRFVFVICVSADGKCHSAPLYYAFDRKNAGLAFQSSETSLHSVMLKQNVFCSGSIYDCTQSVSDIKGIQFQAQTAPELLTEGIEKKYRDLFPESRQLNGRFHYLRILSAKMTDNTVSFGFKRHFER